MGQAGGEEREGKRGRRWCTGHVKEREHQHMSATSPRGSWLSGGQPHLKLEVPLRGQPHQLEIN